MTILAKKSSTNTSFEKDMEVLIKDMGIGIWGVIKQLFICMWGGIRKLKEKKYFYIFATSVIVGEIICLFKATIFQSQLLQYLLKSEFEIPLKYGISYFPIILSYITLIVIGGRTKANNSEYEEAFKEIGFKGKNGTLPFLIDKKNDGKKTILYFKSVIPLSDWLNNKKILETGLDCNILTVANGKSKRVVKMTVVSSEYQIPEYIRWNDSYMVPDESTVVVGKSLLEDITFNLNSTAHALIAGETGSGKSVILRCALNQMACKGAKIYMFDFKGGMEFNSDYEKIGIVITERKKAIAVLDEILAENQLRMDELKRTNCKNIVEYNKKARTQMCRICIFSDEAAEMMDKKGANKSEKEQIEQIAGKISSIARLCRATGINLFLGVQRPDANVITGQIKANLPVRICGRFADRPQSEIVLDNDAATRLPDIKGRFLFKTGYETIEFQSFYFIDENDMTREYRQKGVMLSDAFGSGLAYNIPQEPIEAEIKPKHSKRGKEKNYEEMSIKESEKADELLKNMNSDYDFEDDEKLPF